MSDQQALILEIRDVAADFDRLSLDAECGEWLKRRARHGRDALLAAATALEAGDDPGDELYKADLRKALGGVPDGSAESLARWLDYHGAVMHPPFGKQLTRSAAKLREQQATIEAATRKQP